MDQPNPYAHPHALAASGRAKTRTWAEPQSRTYDAGGGIRTRTEVALLRILSPLSLTLTMRYYWLFFFAYVKMCKFMCKFCKTASKIRPILYCLFEIDRHIDIMPAQSIKYFTLANSLRR